MPSLHPVRLNASRNGGSGVVPPALLDEKKIPKFYQDAISLCGACTASQLPNTSKVYNLMVTSNLSRADLGNIWSLVNRTKPGQLTRQEFYSCLALIALAQKGESLEALCGVSSLPIPSLQSFTVNSVVSAKIKTKNNKKDQKPIVDSIKPSFSTRVSSVQSSKIVDFKSSSVVEVKSNKLPCVEDLFGPEPSTETIKVQASTSKNNSLADDFIYLDFVPQLVEPLSNFNNSNVPEESQKRLERISVWQECLAQATSIYSDAQKLLSSDKSLNSAQLNQIFQETQRGDQYQQSLQAIHTVEHRIGCAIKSCLGQTYSEKELSLSSQLKAVEQQWNELQQYFSYDYSTTCLPNNSSCCCNICLQVLDSNSIEFVSHLYHAGCANFYINRVGPLLPQLL